MVCSSSRAWAFSVFEFLVQRFELFLEVLVAHVLARRDADVAAGVERPALRLDLLERRGLAQAGHVGVLRASCRRPP